MSFKFIPQKIPDIILIEPSVFGDERGFFLESYKKSEFMEAGIILDFVQDNHSCSAKGVLRGLHYQTEPHAQGKLIRVLRGRIFDVVVDIRKNSPWYGQYVSVELSEKNRNLFWIPPGFAHGFCALEENSEIYYKTTDEYSPDCDHGIQYDDPAIGIVWPDLGTKFILSKKDSHLPKLAHAENNFVYKKK